MRHQILKTSWGRMRPTICPSVFLNACAPSERRRQLALSDEGRACLHALNVFRCMLLGHRLLARPRQI